MLHNKSIKEMIMKWIKEFWKHGPIDAKLWIELNEWNHTRDDVSPLFVGTLRPAVSPPTVANKENS